MFLDPTELKRGQILQKGKIKYIILYCDRDGTVFVGLFKRRGSPKNWQRIAHDLWRHKSTGDVYTIIHYGPHPLMVTTKALTDLRGWSLEEEDIRVTTD